MLILMMKQIVSTIFFEYFFPSIKGHAAKIDKFHSNQLSPYFFTAQKGGQHLKFHQPNPKKPSNLGYDPDWDPDYKVKRCYTLLIAAASEHHVGVDLWKKGRSGGRHLYPDFGKYESYQMFQLFCSAVPYC